MKETGPESMAERLDRLEREIGRLAAQLAGLKWIGIALAIAVLGTPVLLYEAGVLDLDRFGTAGPVAVTPEGIEYRNRQGNNTAVLWNDKWGAPHVYILDKAKNVRMTVNVSQDGAPNLELHDGSGLRGLFEVGPDGTATVNLVGEGKKGGISMRVRPDGTPTLTLTDKDGKTLFQAPQAAPGPSEKAGQ